MKIVRHRKRSDGMFVLVVWIDTSKTLDNGDPDPAYLRRFEWPPTPSGMTQAEYVQMQLREAKGIIQAEAVPAVGNALASEGTTI